MSGDEHTVYRRLGMLHVLQVLIAPYDEYQVMLVMNGEAATDFLPVFKALRPGGNVVVIPSSASPHTSVHTGLLLAGFVDVSDTAGYPAGGDKAVKGRRPQWDVGAAASVSLPSRAAVKPAISSWKLGANDVADEELVDQDMLLDDTPVPLAAKGANDDCGPGAGGRKRACKNCTCGRAEEEAEAQEVSAPSSSSCGNCYKGDAFRCSGCPFLGMPAFEPGQEKVMLKL
jgi:anamorsin